MYIILKRILKSQETKYKKDNNNTSQTNIVTSNM